MTTRLTAETAEIAEEDQKNRIAEEISFKVQESHGFKPKVVLLQVTELEDAIENNPYQRSREARRQYMAYDLFISYHRPDRDQVMKVRQRLIELGLESFLDSESLTAGIPWPEAIESALSNVKAVIVFVGEHGLGEWQRREIAVALERQVQASRNQRIFPVIPVLLPGGEPAASFLFVNNALDLRSRDLDSEALHPIITAVREPDNSISLAPVPQRSICPYRGLQAFRAEHSGLFFGRDSIVDRLAERLHRSKLIALVGPSGTGKTSVVHAGLVPRLIQQIPPSVTWKSISFNPGRNPFRRLASSVIYLLDSELTETDRLREAQKLGDQLASGMTDLEDIFDRVLEVSEGTDRILMIVDQFEELFTHGATGADIFLHSLLRATEQASLHVLLTVRADFYESAVSVSREFGDRFSDGVINIGLMTHDEIRSAIESPAHLVNLNFEKGLVERILDDVGDEPGGLPLLEFALTELWDRSEGQLLTHSAYTEAGEVAGAVARRAESVYSAIDAGKNESCRRLFTRLVRVGPMGQGFSDTRRQASFDNLTDDEQTIVAEFTNARLLVSGFDVTANSRVVNIAHEALIRKWSRLRDWLDDDRAFLLWRQRLASLIVAWEDSGRDTGGLLRGGPLAESKNWLRERVEEISTREKRFIELSASESEAAQSLAKRRRTRQRVLFQFTILFAIGLALSVFWGTREARRRAEVARGELARRLSTQATFLLSEKITQTPKSVQLAIDSLQEVPSIEAHTTLRRGTELLPELQQIWQTPRIARSLVFSPDGKHLLTDLDFGLCVWRLEDGHLLQQIERGTNASFDQKGSSVISSVNWSVLRNRFDAGETESIFYDPTGSTIGAARITPDGKHLVLLRGNRVEVRGMETKRLESTFELRYGGSDHFNKPYALSLDGRFAIDYAEPTVVVWDTLSGKPHWRATFKSVASAAFTTDGNHVIVYTGGTVFVQRLQPNQLVAAHTIGEALTRFAYDPLNNYLATVSDANWSVAQVWDLKSGREIKRLVHPKHEQSDFPAIFEVAFNPGGTAIATAANDNTIAIWQLPNTIPPPYKGGHYIVSDGDRRYVAVGTDEKTVGLYDLDSGRRVLASLGKAEVGPFDLSQDGSRLAVARGDSVVVIQVASRQETATASLTSQGDSADRLQSVKFSPNGGLLAYGSLRESWVLDLRTKMRMGPLAPSFKNSEDPSPEIKAPSLRFDASGETLFFFYTPEGFNRFVSVWKLGPSLSEWHPDGSAIVGTEGLYLWAGGSVFDVASHKKLLDINAAGYLGTLPAFDPRRPRIAGVLNRRLVVHDLTRNREIWSASAADFKFDYIPDFKFGPNGDRIALAERNRVKVFHLNQSENDWEIEQEDWVSTIEFTAAGDHLAMATANVVTIWSIEDRKEIARFYSKERISGITFSAKGDLIAFSTSRPLVLEWRTANLISRACEQLRSSVSATEWNKCRESSNHQ